MKIEEFQLINNQENTILDISISDNRVAIQLKNDTTFQLIVWDLKETKHKDLKTQIQTAFAICPKIKDLITHLRINGYEAVVEDIYKS